jgi:hypothetical protein
MCGFDSHYVYYEMCLPELNYHFVTAVTLMKRGQQMFAGTLMGTVGSFFVKENEKTIIEMLSAEIANLKAIFSYVDMESLKKLSREELEQKELEEKARKKAELDRKGKAAINNLLKQMSGFSPIKLNRGGKP